MSTHEHTGPPAALGPPVFMAWTLPPEAAPSSDSRPCPARPGASVRRTAAASGCKHSCYVCMLAVREEPHRGLSRRPPRRLPTAAVSPCLSVGSWRHLVGADANCKRAKAMGTCAIARHSCIPPAAPPCALSRACVRLNFPVVSASSVVDTSLHRSRALQTVFFSEFAEANNSTHH